MRPNHRMRVPGEGRPSCLSIAPNNQMLVVRVEGNNGWAEEQTEQLDGQEETQQLIDPGR